MQKIKLAIFISGKGTNAIRLIEYFQDHPSIAVALVVCNNPNSPFISDCKKQKIPIVICSNSDAANSNYLFDICVTNKIDFIVLAGFLRKIPESFIAYYAEKIFNVHPSLLPKFGGPGMYGDYVHNAVLAAGELKSGVTIHLVNEEYDRGRILAQFECSVDAEENIDSLKSKIRKLEHENYGKVIADYILERHG